MADFDTHEVWTSTDEAGRYRLHRIPGILVTSKQTVLIYCEGRTGDLSHSLEQNGDWERIDLLLRRSTDGGRTFAPATVLVFGTEEAATVNNPVMMEDQRGRLHLLFAKNYSLCGGGLWHTVSEDDGVSWCEPTAVTAAAEAYPHDCFAFGPTHGICTKDGRLVTAVWAVAKGTGADMTAHTPSQVHLFYSDDHGDTWQMSAPCGAADETAVAELADGRILLNSRATPYRRLTAADKSMHFSPTCEATDLPDPGCCGGMTVLERNGKRILLFVNCKTTAARERVSISLSADEGASWQTLTALTEESGGYSDIAVTPSHLLILYEEEWGKRLRLARIPLSALPV